MFLWSSSYEELQQSLNKLQLSQAVPLLSIVIIGLWQQFQL